MNPVFRKPELCRDSRLVLEALEERIVLDGAGDAKADMFDGEWHDLDDGTRFIYNYWGQGCGYWWLGDDDTGIAYDYSVGEWWAEEGGTWTLVSDGGGSTDLFYDGAWIDLYNDQWFQFLSDRYGSFWSEKGGFEAYFRYDFDTGQWDRDADNDYTTPGDWVLFGFPDAPHYFVYDGPWYELPDSYWFQYQEDGYGYWWYDNGGSVHYFAYGYQDNDWWWDQDGQLGTGDWQRIYDPNSGDNFIFDGDLHTLDDGADYYFSGGAGYWAPDGSGQFAYEYQTGQWWWSDGSDWYALGDAGADSSPIYDGAWHTLASGLDYKYETGSHYWVDVDTGGFRFEIGSETWLYDLNDNPTDPNWLEFRPLGDMTDADAEFLYGGDWHLNDDGSWLQMEAGLVMRWYSDDEGFISEFQYEYVTEDWFISTTGDWQNPIWNPFDAPLSSGDYIYDGALHQLPDDLQYRYHDGNWGDWLYDGANGLERYAYEHDTGQWWEEDGTGWVTYGDPYQYSSYPHFLFANDAPVINHPGDFITDEDEAVVFSQANGNAVIIEDPDAGSMDIQVTLAVTDGTLNLSQTDGLLFDSGADGTSSMVVTGSLDDINAALDGMTFMPPDQFNGTIGLLVDVNDLGNSGTGGAQQSSVWIQMDVQAVNDDPVAQADAYSTDEDSSLTVPADGVLDNDTDEDTGDVLNAVAWTGTSAYGATVTLNADGSFSYDPTGSATLQALATGTSVDDTFTYTVEDGNGGSDTGTVTITVSGQNDDPTANDDSGYSTDEDTPIDVPAPGVLDNDSDGDTGDSFDVTDYDVTSAYGASITVNADGSFSYDPTGSATLQALDNGESVDDTFSYTITDNNGGIATAVVTVHVDGYNATPTVSLNPPTGVQEDADYWTGVDLGSAFSVSDDDPLVVDIEGRTGCDWLEIDAGGGGASVSGSGNNWRIEGTAAEVNTALGTLRAYLHENFNGTARVGIQVSDGSLSDTDELSFSVEAINDAPDVSVPGSQTTDRDTPLTINGISVSDVDDQGGAMFARVSCSHGSLTLGSTSGITITEGSNGSGLVGFTGTESALQAALSGLVYDPDSGYTGSDTILVHSEDNGNTGSGGNQSDDESIAVTVKVPNGPPTGGGLSAIDVGYPNNNYRTGTIIEIAFDDAETAENMLGAVVTAVYEPSGPGSGFLCNGGQLYVGRVLSAGDQIGFLSANAWIELKAYDGENQSANAQRYFASY
jgi:VCBS repeat-containing protein